MDYILEADTLTYQHELNMLDLMLNEEFNAKETFKKISNTVAEKIKRLVKIIKDFIDKHIKPMVNKMKKRNI